MNPVIHFEMPAQNSKRVADFYTTVFGWQMQSLGAEMGEYVMATTTESDENGPKRPGAINGGFFPKKDGQPAQHPMLVIEVPDLQTHMMKVTEAGGKILNEPVEIPGVGWYVSFEDSEGNRVNLLQPPAK